MKLPLGASKGFVKLLCTEYRLGHHEHSSFQPSKCLDSETWGTISGAGRCRDYDPWNGF